MNPAVLRAIAGIKESAWTPIHYPNAIWDEQDQPLVSDAQVAEVPFTAFTSRTKAEHVDGRLNVRWVKRLNRASVPSNQGEQGELFATYRHHAIFTDTALEMPQAETTHRGHAIIEQVHADLRAGPLAHLPSSSFSANGAWLVLAAIAFNLTRAAGAIASVFHAKATAATIRRQLPPSRPGSPPPRGGWSCTCHGTGPGRTAGKSCAPAPADHPGPPPPNPPSPAGRDRTRNRGRAGQIGGHLTPSADRHPENAHASPQNPAGGSGLKRGRWLRRADGSGGADGSSGDRAFRALAGDGDPAGLACSATAICNVITPLS